MNEVAIAKRTAIKRNKLSAPVKYLLDNGRLNKNQSILDYGCGRGDDVARLQSFGYSITGYDPNWCRHPEVLNKKYDVILCTYVLNVVSPKTREEIIRKIKSMLNVDGQAFLTVRRDIRIDTISQTGTYQYPVYLSLDKVIENSGYCIYTI